MSKTGRAEAFVGAPLTSRASRAQVAPFDYGAVSSSTIGRGEGVVARVLHTAPLSDYNDLCCIPGYCELCTAVYLYPTRSVTSVRLSYDNSYTW